MDKLETKPDSESASQKASKKQITLSKTFSITIQFAFIILLPLLAFGYLGKWLENHYHNKLWLIGALIIALSTSTIWFYRKISDLYKDFID